MLQWEQQEEEEEEEEEGGGEGGGEVDDDDLLISESVCSCLHLCHYFRYKLLFSNGSI
jgi:hypothetical protein